VKQNILIKSIMIDDNTIAGRQPIWRERFLFLAAEPSCDGKRYFITIDGTSKRWLSEEQVESYIKDDC